MNLSKTCFALTLVIAGLSGCATTEKQATQAMNDSLRTDSGSYKDMRTYPGGVTCGKYLAKDFQGLPEYKAFVVVDTEANLRPTKMDLAVFCTDDPKSALNAELGIDYDAQKSTISAILADFEALEAPLLGYEKDNRSFPWTEQGLEALVEPTTKGNPPRNFPEGGYISAIPSDPWGNAYDYDCPPFAGIRVLYKLQSFGADGVKGGNGENADIKHTYLKYFRHVESLE